uniref:Uncharacterized protein n=1 Tax=Strongyloides stercoralis TaxID=6248 RepID=A0AAF5DHR5_STRER
MTSSICNIAELVTSSLTKSSISMKDLKNEKNTTLTNNSECNTSFGIDLPQCEKFLIEPSLENTPPLCKKIVTISNCCKNEAGGVVNQLMTMYTKYVTECADCINFWTATEDNNINKHYLSTMSPEDEDSGIENSIYDNNNINVSMNSLSTISFDNNTLSRTISESSSDDIFYESPTPVILFHCNKNYTIDKATLQAKSKKFFKIFEENTELSSFKIPRPFMINYLTVSFCNFSTKNIYGILRLAFYYEIEELIMDGENWIEGNFPHLDLSVLYHFLTEFGRINLISSLLEYVRNNFETFFHNDILMGFDFLFFSKIFCEIILPDVDIHRGIIIFMEWINYDYVRRNKLLDNFVFHGERFAESVEGHYIRQEKVEKRKKKYKYWIFTIGILDDGKSLINSSESNFLGRHSIYHINTKELCKWNDQNITVEAPEFPVSVIYKATNNIVVLESVFNLIYHPKHLYCIIIDDKSISDFIRKYIMRMSQCLPNIFVTNKQDNIRGHGLECLNILIHYKWNYTIILSENDIPIKNVPIYSIYSSNNLIYKQNTYGGIGIFKNKNILLQNNYIRDKELVVARTIVSITLSREDVNYYYNYINGENYIKFISLNLIIRKSNVFWPTLLTNKELNFPSHNIKLRSNSSINIGFLSFIKHNEN